MFGNPTIGTAAKVKAKATNSQERDDKGELEDKGEKEKKLDGSPSGVPSS